jgi:Entericidin EcnA/B family.
MRRTFVVIATFAALATAAVTTVGCNTVAGVGRDASAVGHAVTSAAEDAKS